MVIHFKIIIIAVSNHYIEVVEPTPDHMELNILTILFIQILHEIFIRTRLALSKYSRVSLDNKAKAFTTI